MKEKKIVITYGTFDLFHIGHLQLLERLKKLGDYLIVAVSTDEFNQRKGKNSIYSYHERSRIVAALACVDQVIPERNWEQKVLDVKEYQVDLFAMGDDWEGHFEELRPYCDVVFLKRTENVSSTSVKKALSQLDDKKIVSIKNALDNVMEIVNALE